MSGFVWSFLGFLTEVDIQITRAITITAPMITKGMLCVRKKRYGDVHDPEPLVVIGGVFVKSAEKHLHKILTWEKPLGNGFYMEQDGKKDCKRHTLVPRRSVPAGQSDDCQAQRDSGTEDCRRLLFSLYLYCPLGHLLMKLFRF